jgi:hypothetical protein
MASRLSEDNEVGVDAAPVGRSIEINTGEDTRVRTAALA